MCIVRRRFRPEIDSPCTVNEPHRNDALSFDLNATLRENHAVERPKSHSFALDLSFNLCASPRITVLFGNDVPVYVAVDAERPGDRQCPSRVHPDR